MDLMITLRNGLEVSLMQAIALKRLLDQMGDENCHWHENTCGCCLTLHGPDCAYVIGRDGQETFFAGRGCACAN